MLTAREVSVSTFYFTSSFERMGLRNEPTIKMVNKEKISVSVRITGPIASSVELLRANAYAIAPRRPEIHITTYWFHLIFELSLLPLFTSQLTQTTFKALAMLRLMIVVNTKSHVTSL